MRPRASVLALAAVASASAVALGACRSSADDGPCTCTPGNVSNTRSVADSAPMDGRALLERLRRHKRLVDENRNPRDIKVFDDELRHALLSFCQPCSSWVGERMTMEQMFPLHRLDYATSAVCMGLILRDGTTAYGEARPRSCR
ncbi:MAG TPA: hypothetical protein VNO30_11440 [Kofleriaceae bacterium]|nr:hypothetical protein [Kofleriaceae bacterium]